MAFDYRGRKFLVGSSKECRLWLLDRDALGGEDHRTTLDTTPLVCNDAQAFDERGVWGALSAWEDPSGTQWVLMPFWGPVSTSFKAPIEYGRPKGGAVAAFKLQEQAGKWKLVPAWMSRDMDLAEEAIIANGIVFAYSAGEDASQVVPDGAWNEPSGPRYGGGLSSGPVRRIPGSRKSVLYALDGLTGKELWSSGTQIDVVEPLQRADGRQRPRLHRHVRWRAVLFRRGQVGETLMRTSHLISAALIGASIGGVTLAQVGRGGSEWLAGGGDAQRTSWIRTDAKISLETMSKPGFELQWTTNPGNRPRGLNGLTQGVSANGVTLFVPMSVVAGSSNNVYGIDNDTGYIVWSRTFDAPLPAPTAACPGGITAAPARIVSLTPTAAPAAQGFGGGRAGAGYRSLLGEPGEGVPVEAPGGGRPAGPPPGATRGGCCAAGRCATAAAGAPPPAAGAGAGAAAGARRGAPGAPRGAGAPPCWRWWWPRSAGAWHPRCAADRGRWRPRAAIWCGLRDFE